MLHSKIKLMICACIFEALWGHIVTILPFFYFGQVCLPFLEIYYGQIVQYQEGGEFTDVTGCASRR